MISIDLSLQHVLFLFVFLLSFEVPGGGGGLREVDCAFLFSLSEDKKDSIMMEHWHTP